ncbi:hypothetical protein PR048_021267 [Dryococelus australis]|uniref:Uncharacterized protein n=1 Tax=Dryococelus australis TaxID=614101 RepID=A0ABQ9GXS6_9NEOP|nr:hypothetical protein PR048_021267 [Dryococelus australis]
MISADTQPCMNRVLCIQDYSAKLPTLNIFRTAEDRVNERLNEPSSPTLRVKRTPALDKIDVKHVYTEVDFAIGSQFIRLALDDSEPMCSLYHEQPLSLGAAAAWWSDFSPPTKANRARFPAELLPYSRKWESCRTMPLAGGFSRGSPVPPAFESPFSSRYPPSALNTSKLRAGTRIFKGDKIMFPAAFTMDGRVSAVLAHIEIGDGSSPARVMTAGSSLWAHDDQETPSKPDEQNVGGLQLSPLPSVINTVNEYFDSISPRAQSRCRRGPTLLLLS